MRAKTTTAITEVKREVQLREWAEQIKARQESGLTVTAYCAANGINTKTYYYQLRKIREHYVEAVPAIVPLTMQVQCSCILIEKNGTQITLPADVSPELLITLMRELC